MNHATSWSEHQADAPATGTLAVLVKTWPKLSETFILEEILGLERRGWSLRLYAMAAPTDALTHAALKRVRAPVTYLPEPARARAGELAAGHWRALRSTPIAYLSELIRMARRGRAARIAFWRAGWLADRMRADHIGHLHAHFISAPTELAAIAARLAGRPFSISAHAKDIYLSKPAELRRRLCAARFTVTCTEANAQALQAIAPEATVHRMYHGVDRGQFQSIPSATRQAPENRAPLLLSIGRLREKKGLDTLIDACALLVQRGLAFDCEIVGYGPELARLTQRISDLRLHARVRLTGALTREQVIERYQRATVYVQPSRVAADGDRDGIPNVLLEAMAMELPVIATRVSGIPELVRDGLNGRLIEPDAPPALADAIAALLAQPALAAQWGSAARRTVAEHFDNDRNLALLSRLLREAGAWTAPISAARRPRLTTPAAIDP